VPSYCWMACFFFMLSRILEKYVEILNYMLFLGNILKKCNEEGLEVSSFCSNCGKEFKSEQLFCNGCGAKIGIPSSPVPNNFPQMERTIIKQKNNKNTYIVVFSVIGLILVLAAAYYIVNVIKESKQEVSRSVTTAVYENTEKTLGVDKKDSVNETGNGEDAVISSYVRKLNLLRINSYDTDISIGRWEIINRNGTLILNARNIPSKELVGIFELYDEGNLTPLQSWAREVYFLAEDLSRELNADWKIEVGNTCSPEHPYSLPDADLTAYSGSCGYSIPVLSGTDKDNLSLVINSSVFFSSVASDVPVSSEFIFPGSNIRRLTESEIEYLSLEELSLARNEIFARHGRIFKTDALQYYFEGKSWYNPDPYYDDNLSNIETYNVNLIKKREEFLK
jgi:hypothetical protein